MSIFALKQTVDFYHDQGTPVYKCFLDAKNAFNRVNHWTLAKKLLVRNVPLYIVKLLIFSYREQDYVERWRNSLLMTFRCSNGISQWGQLYTDDINHHIQATGVGCYVGGAFVNSLSYADDMVLLAPRVTALLTLLIWRYVAHMLDLMTLYTTQRNMLVRPKQSQGRYSTGVGFGDEDLSFVDEFRYL